MSVMLKVSDVHKTFETDGQPVEVLRGVSFEVAAGQALAVTGPSGSGKSTLLHLIGALDKPTSGSIEIDGREPYGLAERELGWKPQHGSVDALRAWVAGMRADRSTLSR